MDFSQEFVIDFFTFALYNSKNVIDIFLPPGKELSVRLSIVRPLKIESSDAIFL